MTDSDGQSQSPNNVYPTVAMYGPCTVRNLKKGETKLWCACGLSKKQPWCDGSHKDTGIKPLKWTVNKSQSLFAICACKYTKDPPFCDATHTNLPCEVLARQKSCTSLHVADKKLCTGCGWVPDF
ncbi:CDGSH iron-sulfur domain-containing protein 3, mitochondrial-like [Ylistrum balloti]|uniref:CDGSH iron-sulfur domain-containing protein 3, mitochondrial-like n=1 Tax=Ylistrum balloti TaxID=509963 RepID=UPI002905973D|nr:CDGSH iron-sulfur domain-containing protein 3, mitochondrial-like [Ylistrum balloti]